MRELAAVERRAALASYKLVERRLDGCAWVRGNVRVIASAAEEEDGRTWLHVSVSHPDRLPSYQLLCDVKDTFVGADRTALQLFPPRAKHVNIHDHCLHLWACLDSDPLPDFTRGLETI